MATETGSADREMTVDEQLKSLREQFRDLRIRVCALEDEIFEEEPPWKWDLENPTCPRCRKPLKEDAPTYPETSGARSFYICKKCQITFNDEGMRL